MNTLVERLQTSYQYCKQKVTEASNIVVDQLTSEHTQKVALSSMVFGSALFALFITAFIIYLIFYLVSIPVVSKTVPIYFDYSVDKPIATLDFLQYTDTGLLMKPNQRYNLAIQLECPDSDHNLALGNFMIKLDLMNAQNNTLQSAIRPAHLKYKSFLLKSLSTFYNSFSLLMDFKLESQSITVDLIENFHEVYARPIRTAKIELSTDQLQTYSTYLVVNTHFQGLYFYMYHWWFTTGLLFITNIMLSEILIVAYVWNVVLAYMDKAHKVYDEEIDTEVSPPSDNHTRLLPTNSTSKSFTDDSASTAFGEQEGDQDLSFLDHPDNQYHQDSNPLLNAVVPDTYSSTESEEYRGNPSMPISYNGRVYGRSGNFSQPYNTAKSETIRKRRESFLTLSRTNPTPDLEPTEPITTDTNVSQLELDEFEMAGLLEDDDEIRL
ncbi:Berardinelli-Seip congenital lipodystrophy 2 (seipin) [Globomyces sp. JEL0801]|nr:Berardinelli-Seip congenital lipodystrophy 2 (seipin) [Globomyces sp. JEL0801]